MARIQTFDEYIQQQYREWLEASKKHLGRAIDPREGGIYDIYIKPAKSLDEDMFYETISLNNLVKALKGQEKLSEAQKRNLDRIGDNYTIHIFTQNSDFNTFYDKLKIDFKENDGYIVTSPKYGNPYEEKFGLSFNINKKGCNPHAVGAVISHLDEWQDNFIMARWHNNSGAKDFVLKMAENILKNGYQARFGVGHEYNGVAGAFHDPDWKKTE